MHEKKGIYQFQPQQGRSLDGILLRQKSKNTKKCENDEYCARDRSKDDILKVQGKVKGPTGGVDLGAELGITVGHGKGIAIE